MTPDEIIDMARHTANTFGTRMCDENGLTHGEELYVMGIDEIVEAIKFVAAKEREACAKVCEDTFETWCKTSDELDDFPAPRELAAAIRARGQA